MKRRTTDGYVNTDDPLHEALSKLTVAQKLEMIDRSLSKTTSSPAPSTDPNDPNRPETEEDSVIVQDRRRFLARRGLMEQPAQTHGSSLSPSSTPATQESGSPQPIQPNLESKPRELFDLKLPRPDRPLWRPCPTVLQWMGLDLESSEPEATPLAPTDE